MQHPQLESEATSTKSLSVMSIDMHCLFQCLIVCPSAIDHACVTGMVSQLALSLNSYLTRVKLNYF